MRTQSNLPHPVGAVAGDWTSLTDYHEDTYRVLTWSRHDVAEIVVAVQGEQYADGRVERHVALYPTRGDAELTAKNARRLAAALLDAADAMDRL